MDVIFGAIGRDQEKWMRGYLVLVDCVYMGLRNGSMKKKDVLRSVC